MDLLSMLGLGLAGAIALWWGFARMRLRQAPPSSTQTRGRGKGRNTDNLDTVMSWQPQATRVLTPAERKVFSSLRRNLPDHLVLAQVPLARFLKVPTRHSYSEWLRRVGLMCADIVVCDSASQVVAVIDIRPAELQESDRARARNARMDRVIRGAGIALHIWREDALPNATVARNAVLQLPLDTPMETPLVSAPAVPASRGLEVSLDPPSDDDLVEPGIAPPSTWFDDLDTSPSPLAPEKPASPPRSQRPPR
jgi:hypothetical protein